MMWSHGKFYWNELMSRDAEASKQFFAATLGWSFDAMPNPNGGTYWIAMLGGEPVAGILPIDSPQFAGVPEAWLSYIAVDDVDARAQRATATGGKVMREPFDIAGVGRIAILMDSRGAAIGLMTPAKSG